MLNVGPGEEHLAEAVRAASGCGSRAMSCSVGELIALSRRASLFVGGDTGPMHLAAALGVPVVALFGPTRPERNGPYATRAAVLRSPASIDNSSHTDHPDAGLHSISPQQVIAAADELLKEQDV
jgi:heptosyltransferase-1